YVFLTNQISEFTVRDIVIIFISIFLLTFFLLFFRKKSESIIKSSFFKFINKYLYIIFPIISILLFVAGFTHFSRLNNFYNYAYWSIFFSIITLYLSSYITHYINKVFFNFEKNDTEKINDSDNIKNIHFVNLFISSFFKLLTTIITIVIIILVWTLPFDILKIILLNFNIAPIEVTKVLIGKIFHLLIIFIIGGLVIYLSKVIGDNIYYLIEDNNKAELNENEARAKTLINVTRNIVKVVVFVFILFSFLQEIGINIATLLAGAGIVGIAIGFGSQSLIKDFFSGFFILVENQYAVGDIIKIGEVSGLVEKITLRITVLRNLEGVVHIIPNGQITTVSNMTHEWSRSVIDINVSYNENIQKVFDVLNKLSEEFYKDIKWQPLMVSQPEILGIDRLGEYNIVVRLITTTKPMKRWDITRELNKRIKNKFDEVGIEIPYPHMKIITKE
ncbi:MAG TPA: mechanosensitive ion channel family protein, partial [Spirochaetota bacterium]|nr:mechanosensitive ion channel family protein [Spirochaetota bacterium]